MNEEIAGIEEQSEDSWLTAERMRLHENIRGIPNDEIDKMFDLPPMRPILDLYATQFIQENVIGGSSTLRLTVTYTEPPEEGEIRGRDIKHSRPFDQRFLKYAYAHHKYWRDKAFVPMNIATINYDPENASKDSNW